MHTYSCILQSKHFKRSIGSLHTHTHTNQLRNKTNKIEQNENV